MLLVKVEKKHLDFLSLVFIQVLGSTRNPLFKNIVCADFATTRSCLTSCGRLPRAIFKVQSKITAFNRVLTGFFRKDLPSSPNWD